MTAHPQAVHDLGRAGLLVAAAWSAAFVALVLVRLARATSARRRVELPVLLPAAAAIALFGARALHGSERGFLSNDPTDRALWAAQVAALVLVAAGVAWARVRARRMRGRLARLVVDLGQSPPPGGLRDQLASAFGDPSLQLLHARDDEAGWVDGDGRPAELPHDPDRQVTRLRAGGRELSAVVHRPGLLEEPAMAAELADAARLALEHERLGAIRRAQLESLRASRGRIVATADAERRSLERDLHDGAQQRLATLAIAIRLARRQLASAGPAPRCRARRRRGGPAGGARGAARARPRADSRGARPRGPQARGGGARRPVAAPRRRRPARASASPRPWSRRRTSWWPSRCAAAGDGDVAVSARREDGRLLVALEAAGGIAGSTTDLEDRVGAVGGTLTASAHDVLAELPCES